MDFQIKKFTDFTMSSWNNLLFEMDGPIHNCNWNNLNYYSAYKKVTNYSRAIFYENKLVALFPFAKNYCEEKINFSFGNNLLFSPIFSPSINTSIRKKIYFYFFKIIKEQFDLKKLKIKIQVSPIYFENSRAKLLSKNQFELIEFSKSYIVHNTLIIDLEKNQDLLLSSMSKYHRRNILRAEKIKNLKFNCVNFRKKEEVKKKFDEFRKYHKISAGRVTRPIKTWEIMLDKIFKCEADLFYLNYENKSISYLYCAKFSNFAWGWSQVNVSNFEYLSPRHILEWNTIKYYKEKKFNFYEIGERFYDQKNFKPTDKEKSISVFKEKFGSDKYPKVIFNVEV